MDITQEMVMKTLEMFVFLAVELSVLFIIISAGVSLLQQYISNEKIQSMLGASHGRGYFLAAMLGAITPFCSCSTIPMLRGLIKANAGFGPMLTFLFTSPLLNPIIIGLFVVTFGLKITLVYAIVALIISIVAGIVLSTLKFDRFIIPEGKNTPASSCCTDTPKNEPTTSCCTPEPVVSCCSAEPVVETSCCGVATLEPAPCCDAPKIISNNFSNKLKSAFYEGLKQFKSVFPYLLVGVTLGALIYGIVPSELITKYAGGDSLLAVPISAVIGIPLYVRVEALIPICAALVENGMGQGPIMALIIGGGGASITELILLKSMFRTPMMIAFVTVIISMAITAGYILQFAL